METEEGNCTVTMNATFVKLNKLKYDRLCHDVRHLTTLAKRVGKRSTRIERIILELSEELVEKRTELEEKIKNIEMRLRSLEGSVLPCEDCPNNGACSDTDSRNSKA